LVKNTSLSVHGFFTNRGWDMIYYKYKEEAVRKADAVATAADKPTAAL